MEVRVHLISQSKPIVHDSILNTYVKSGMYCLMVRCGEVYKYPMVNIFRVTEIDK